MRLFLSFLLFILFFSLKGQTKNEMLIPLRLDIEVNIIAMDTMQLEFYNLYRFEYNSQEGKVVGGFWADKSVPVFKPGLNTVKLCRIYNIRTRTSDGVDIQTRGCEIYERWLHEDVMDSVRLDYFDLSTMFMQLCSTN